MLIESYNRMQKDVKASHILISLDEEATNKDQKSAYDKALKIRKSILDGEISFSDAAKSYSDDNITQDSVDGSNIQDDDQLRDKIVDLFDGEILT